ncbi:hypothetical protein BN1723_011987 [Verticillium longisporum]|uniref:Uncharacterized protein n=1 Tax=Verticillium longisporum TaxID=100787 RepID=A0A0G4LCQ2_VERLO|nr:Choline dehydrogenase [Verticillium dahliae VDG2]PNH61745.1 hypothetical protein VD0002_g6139 [Verticillium dahliae]CRK19853.1 hypothetical protein BN1723_011987 [Verticillium longisporum]
METRNREPHQPFARLQEVLGLSGFVAAIDGLLEGIAKNDTWDRLPVSLKATISKHFSRTAPPLGYKEEIERWVTAETSLQQDAVCQLYRQLQTLSNPSTAVEKTKRRAYLLVFYDIREQFLRSKQHKLIKHLKSKLTGHDENNINNNCHDWGKGGRSLDRISRALDGRGALFMEECDLIGRTTLEFRAKKTPNVEKIATQLRSHGVCQTEDTQWCFDYADKFFNHWKVSTASYIAGLRTQEKRKAGPEKLAPASPKRMRFDARQGDDRRTNTVPERIVSRLVPCHAPNMWPLPLQENEVAYSLMDGVYPLGEGFINEDATWIDPATFGATNIEDLLRSTQP